MKQLIFFLNFILLSGAAYAGQSTRNLESFTKLKVTESITVNLVKAGSNSAEITVQSGDIKDLITKVEGDILRIFWKKGTGYNRTAKVTLNYKQLNGIYTSAGAHVKSDEVVQSDALHVSATSGSKINLDIASNSLDAEANSGSSISLTGKTDSQEIKVTSGATYKAKELISNTADARASSGGYIVIHTNKAIKAKADSGASIKYKGNPSTKDLDESKMTGSSITNF